MSFRDFQIILVLAASVSTDIEVLETELGFVLRFPAEELVDRFLAALNASGYSFQEDTLTVMGRDVLLNIGRA